MALMLSVLCACMALAITTYFAGPWAGVIAFFGVGATTYRLFLYRPGTGRVKL